MIDPGATEQDDDRDEGIKRRSIGDLTAADPRATAKSLGDIRKSLGEHIASNSGLQAAFGKVAEQMRVVNRDADWPVKVQRPTLPPTLDYEMLKPPPDPAHETNRLLRDVVTTLGEVAALTATEGQLSADRAAKADLDVKAATELNRRMLRWQVFAAVVGAIAAIAGILAIIVTVVVAPTPTTPAPTGTSSILPTP